MNRRRLFQTGLLMGAAELIPGISASTIAFLVGFYPLFIEQLSKLSWKSLLSKDTLLFFLPLISGMLISLLFFSQGVKWLLQDPTLRIYTYAFFFGCCLRGLGYFRSQISFVSKKVLLVFILGAFLSLAFSLFPAGYHPGNFSSFLYIIYVVVFGILAICAALLPGISGCYILLVSGLYPRTIESLSSVIFGDVHSLLFLLNLSLGFIIGVALFSRGVSFLLQYHKELFFAFFAGTLLSSLVYIWPFSQAIHAPFTSAPLSIGNQQIIISLLSFSFGFLLVRYFAKNNTKRFYQFVE